MVNNNLITIQEGLNKSGKKRWEILTDFNKDLNYKKLIDKHGKTQIDDFGANCRNFFNWWDDWWYAFIKLLGFGIKVIASSLWRNLNLFLLSFDKDTYG